MEIKSQIIAIRKNADYTQQKLADELLVSRQTISNWENGRSYPDLESLIIISEKFNLTLDELIKGDIKMVNKLDSFIKFGRKAKLIIVCVAMIFISIFTYSMIWHNYDQKQREVLDTKIKWNGYDEQGYFVDIDNLRIHAFRYENFFPNPNFKPFYVMVENKEMIIKTNNSKEFEIFNKKGLSFIIDSEINIVKNKYTVEKRKGQSKEFIRENKNEIENLMKIGKSYYDKLNN
ncbi:MULTISPECIES: helix-turn-helix transcriptional regulator [Carnobacterium]|nr:MULTISPECIES: helix-turn-helix transcriptional regulator [Carnobacterium]MDT1940672.1 helix-turn-helix transcriptional regulator [Carnobacterium divergens]MDT1943110.1 helix-turn-helix transcriptional regulator [Carnobacterium divergens]MDT1948917.1 helix-turn-helix transcriptional regulator [Carnobacterium divergens]MDT1951398.1 helix-turn-helix transcriptional regulator [Carnobacterium divergens]MDT1956455.1 helix-turn-helix transcriptional regulator [Carnobacterium divergens]